VTDRQTFSARFLYHQLGSHRALLADVRNAHGRLLFESIWIKAAVHFLRLGELQHNRRVQFVARLIDGKFYYPTQFVVIYDKWFPKPIPEKHCPPIPEKRCPHCNVQMRGVGGERHSQDHIYPRQWNRALRQFSDSDSTNIRICCQDCNGLRGTTGHCIGALACAQQVAQTERVAVKTIIAKWKLYQFNQAIMDDILERIRKPTVTVIKPTVTKPTMTRRHKINLIFDCKKQA
jgi:hypothetical protein